MMQTFGPSLMWRVSTQGRDRALAAVAAAVDLSSIDDCATLECEQHRQPLPPGLQLFGCQSRPLGDLADDPQWSATAVGPSGVAGELLVGHVRVVFKRPGWLHYVHPRRRVALCEFRSDLGCETGSVNESGEVDVVHHDLGTV